MLYLSLKQNLLYCLLLKVINSILLLQIYTIISLEKIAFNQIIVGLIQFQDFTKFFLGKIQFCCNQVLNLFVFILLKIVIKKSIFESEY